MKSDTPLVEFVFSCVYAVLFCVAGIVKGYLQLWILFGVAITSCVFTLPPVINAVRERRKDKRSNSSYKIIIRSVHGSKICDGCGKKTENIGKCIAISGNERYEAYLCGKCFLKGVTDALKSEDQTEEGGERHEDS